MLLKLVSGVVLSVALAVGMAVPSSVASHEAEVSTAESSAGPEGLIGCCSGDGSGCLNTAQCQARNAGVCGAPCN